MFVTVVSVRLIIKMDTRNIKCFNEKLLNVYMLLEVISVNKKKISAK